MHLNPKLLDGENAALKLFYLTIKGCNSLHLIDLQRFKYGTHYAHYIGMTNNGKLLEAIAIGKLQEQEISQAWFAYGSAVMLGLAILALVTH